MAGFCTKCGSPLASSTGFCTSCGTPIPSPTPVAPVAPTGYAEVPVAQAVPQPATPVYAQVPPASYAPVAPQAGYAQYPPAGYPPAGAPPAKSGSSTGKIILIVVGVLFVIFVIIAGVIGYGYYKVTNAIHAAKVTTTGDGGTVAVPGLGSLSAGTNAISEAALGVPVYPGAAVGKGNMQMNLGAASTVISHYSTDDSVSQVVDFYKSKMGAGTAVASTGRGDGMVLSSGGRDTDRIMVTVGSGSGDDTGKTTIVIMHTKKND